MSGGGSSMKRLPAIPHADFIKIDAEGSEKRILKKLVNKGERVWIAGFFGIWRISSFCAFQAKLSEISAKLKRGLT
jgi:hypothetical protein